MEGGLVVGGGNGPLWRQQILVNGERLLPRGLFFAPDAPDTFLEARHRLGTARLRSVPHRASTAARREGQTPSTFAERTSPPALALGLTTPCFHSSTRLHWAFSRPPSPQSLLAS